MIDLFNEKGSSVILAMIRGIFTVGVGSTRGFVQAWQDVVNFGCSSLSASVWA
jgi:hypothetical protein